MTIDNRWILLLAIATSAAVGAAVASKSRRRHHRNRHDRESATELHSWENEGGNVAPAAVSPVLP
jgi:hypothetical protein